MVGLPDVSYCPFNFLPADWEGEILVHRKMGVKCASHSGLSTSRLLMYTTVAGVLE